MAIKLVCRIIEIYVSKKCFRGTGLCSMHYILYLHIFLFEQNVTNMRMEQNRLFLNNAFPI